METPEIERMRRELHDDYTVIKGCAYLAFMAVIYFLIFSPIHWLSVFFGVDTEVWANVGFAFSQIVAAIFVPFLISSKLNEYMAFRKSGELIELQEKLKTTVRDFSIHEETLSDQVSKTLIDKYNQLKNQAYAIGHSVDNIVSWCRIVIGIGFLVNLCLMCSEHTRALGPFSLWPIFFMPIAYGIAKVRFLYLKICREELNEEYKRKDEAFREHLLAKIKSISNSMTEKS